MNFLKTATSVMKSLKVLFIIISIAAVFAVVRFYSMTGVSRIALPAFKQPPEALARERILYFDDFSDNELSKYRDFLDRYKVNETVDVNNRAIFIAGLINRIHKDAGRADLSEYPEYVIISGNTAYCQRSSILLSLLLSSISIYSRHWHAAGQDNKGFHQFIEYYHPQKHKWIIIDSFYGIQYEKNGQLLSVAEVIELVSKGDNLEGVTKLLDMDRLYYNPAEVKKVWSNKMILARANDYIGYYRPQTRYGFFAKMPFFNQWPEKVQKVFRVFGRNNSMYEVYNFKKQKLSG